jgi:hypothetical protein
LFIRFYMKTPLHLYQCDVKYTNDREKFEIEVYKGSGEYAEYIDGYEDVPVTSIQTPVYEAKEIITTYERPLRLKRYLQMKNHFLLIDEVDPQEKNLPVHKLKKEEKKEFVVHDYETEAEKQRLNYYKLKPGELDYLSEEERSNWLKKDPELRIRYHEYRAFQEASER